LIPGALRHPIDAVTARPTSCRKSQSIALWLFAFLELVAVTDRPSLH
jgi:hypothetical protein